MILQTIQWTTIVTKDLPTGFDEQTDPTVVNDLYCTITSHTSQQQIEFYDRSKFYGYDELDPYDRLIFPPTDNKQVVYT